MPKVTIQISMDLSKVELLSEIKSRYHLKNYSTAIELIINQWVRFMEQQNNNRKNVKEPSKKPSNPVVNL